jgi:hypothetical protein
MSGHRLSKAQVKRLQQMVDKGWPIHSVRYSPLEGHLSVGVSLRRGTRGFWIGQKGELKE